MNAAARPRVLLLCERLDIAGGVERFVCVLANHLAGQGFDVAVGSVATPRAEVAYALDAAVRVVHGHRASAEGDGLWAMLRRQWHVGRALGQLVRAEKPAVVVLNGLTTACSVLALDGHFAARTVCCDHNHFDARSRPWRWLRARLYPRVAAVVSLTQADAPRFAALNPHTEVIYNASAWQASEPAAGVAPGDAPLVLAVGRHVAQKGLDLLLQAWALVAQALPQARLRIVGDGPLGTELQAQSQALGLQASVQWVAPTADIAAHYRAAALFVLPSRYEGMPLALLEAQALGLPAVAFDCPTGPREIISADTGIVVPPGEVAALGQALIKLLLDAELRQRMARAALQRSHEHFSLAAHFQRWTALLLGVAARPSP
jgi:glycosyltransferase involved in cell wall biosynthesis